MTQLCHPSMIDIRSRLLTPCNSFIGEECTLEMHLLFHTETYIYMFIQTCAYEYMRDSDGGVVKYRPISTNTGREAKWGGDDGGNAGYRLWFFCEKECRWPYPLWGLARAKGVDGVPHETRGLPLPLSPLAPYLPPPSYACETDGAKCTAAAFPRVRIRTRERIPGRRRQV